MLSLSLALPVAMVVPALANPTVTSPYNGSTVSSPFTLTANASSCSSQSISSIGYSLDSSSSTTLVSGGYLQKSVSTSNGGHTIHVKSWGNKGAVCVTDVAVTVSTSASSSGNPSVSAPLSGSTVTSPFTVSASSSSCSGQAVSALGYSVDNSTSTTIVNGTVLSKSVSTGTGGHTIHVKAWGKSGASCVHSIAVTVSGTSSSTPTYAVNHSNLQSSGTWRQSHDAGTPGSASGWSALTTSPSRSGHSRHLATSYSSYGGERYHTSFSDDMSKHNFVYDVWVYIKNTTTGVSNLEFDLNQVIGNGWTVIMGFQCDRWSNTWDYTANKGSATRPNDSWIHSGVACNPKNWTVNTWHHVQIAYSRDDSGYVTYHDVTLDGAKHSINAKVFSGFALGWGRTMLTNFQVDGGTSYSSGSDVFIDNMNISSW
jgi:hypothetical protein